MTQPPDAKNDFTAIPEKRSEKDTMPDLDTAGVRTAKNMDSVLIKEKKHPASMESKKFSLGSTTLGWCIFLMVFCILISLWKPENELLQNGFEAFKLIVTTILGYMFGSNAKT